MPYARETENGGRLPWPVAGCIILALSLIGWASLFHVIGFAAGPGFGAH